MRLLTGALTMLRAAAMIAGRAILFIGRALLMNPIGLLVTAIAVAAFLIYKYWAPIKAFFSGLWDSVKNSTVAAWEGIKGFFSGLWSSLKAGAAAAWQSLGGSLPAALATIGAAILNWSPLGLFYNAFAGVLSWFGIELPAKFSTFGANIVSGLVNGIKNMAGVLKDTVVGVASSVGGWFKEKLGIQSPSRVFMQYGAWVSEGAALGISGGQNAVRTAALAMATAATSAVPMATHAAALPPDAQPPLTMPMAAHAAALRLDAKPPQTLSMVAHTAALPTMALPTMAMPTVADAAALRLDTRPPLAAPMAGAAVGGGGNTITITINAAPGMDEQALARAVAAELERRDRRSQFTRRSRLQDLD